LIDSDEDDPVPDHYNVEKDEHWKNEMRKKDLFKFLGK